MAEKKGNTGQLKYDFNTKWSTEVQFKEDGKWFRATCREFRSFDGPRRIFLKNEDNIWEYIEYKGPVYMYNTNTHVVKNNTYKIIYVKIRKIEKRRHEEKWDI
jgi:hypothetical protein